MLKLFKKLTCFVKGHAETKTANEIHIKVPRGTVVNMLGLQDVIAIGEDCSITVGVVTCPRCGSSNNLELWKYPLWRRHKYSQ